MTIDTMRSQRPSDEGADGPVPPVRAPRRTPGMVAFASATMMLIGIAVIALGFLFVVGAALNDALTPSCGDVACSGPGLLLPSGLLMLAAGVVEIVAASQLKSGKAWAWLVGVAIVANSQRQARIIHPWCRDYLRRENLAHLIARDTDDELELTNGMVIVTMPCTARSTRGYALKRLRRWPAAIEAW